MPPITHTQEMHYILICNLPTCWSQLLLNEDCLYSLMIREDAAVLRSYPQIQCKCLCTYQIISFPLYPSTPRLHLNIRVSHIILNQNEAFILSLKYHIYPAPVIYSIDCIWIQAPFIINRVDTATDFWAVTYSRELISLRLQNLFSILNHKFPLPRDARLFFWSTFKYEWKSFCPMQMKLI